jgi:hypothetical protein
VISEGRRNVESRQRRIFERLVDGRSGPPGRLMKAWALLVLPLTAFLLWSWSNWDGALKLPANFFLFAGLCHALAVFLHQREKIAYRLRVAGSLVFHAGFVVFVVSLALAGDWGYFSYAVVAYGAIMALAATGVFSDPATEG